MTVVWLLVAVVAPAWLAGVFLAPSFLRVFGREAWLPGLVFGAWCLAAVAAALWFRPLLPWLAAGGAVLGLGLSWGPLRGWLGLRGTPPGTLSFRAGVRALAHRGYYLRSFERRGPVFKMAQFGAPTICILGLDRISRVMRDCSDMLGPSPLPFAQSVMGNFLRYMDDETHSRYGPLFRKAMAGEATREDAKFIDQVCEREFEAMSRAGVVSPIQPLRRIARRSLSRLLFGFDASGEAAGQFEELATHFAQASIGQSLRRRDRELLREMAQILVGQLDNLGASGRASGPNAPVLARLRQIDAAMPDRTCLDNLVFMHKIATGNVSSLLLWLLHEWATHEDVVARIRACEGDERTVVLDAFLSETLRLNQSEYLYRKVAREFEYEGFRFPRGWMVRFCIWESHRTTDRLARPDRFELRLDKDDYSRQHFLPFGMGRHACNGIDINKAICRTFLQSLATSFDVAVTSADPVQRQMRHWSHWQPNREVMARVGRRV